mmetsp:Transcript_14228/g.32295  ORF Transcript_14228/g.32295 Transcript_14228/m.32295 type:complete len:222 (-) Transcript_14228:728-1393(-)
MTKQAGQQMSQSLRKSLPDRRKSRLRLQAKRLLANQWSGASRDVNGQPGGMRRKRRWHLRNLLSSLESQPLSPRLLSLLHRHHLLRPHKLQPKHRPHRLRAHRRLALLRQCQRRPSKLASLQSRSSSRSHNNGTQPLTPRHRHCWQLEGRPIHNIWQLSRLLPNASSKYSSCKQASSSCRAATLLLPLHQPKLLLHQPKHPLHQPKHQQYSRCSNKQALQQ